jgi:hypothetical protein
MGKNKINHVDDYRENWKKLLESASNFQKLIKDGVIIGGTATALRKTYRFSLDVDYIFVDLQNRFEQVLDVLESHKDWKTARIQPPKMILGNFMGVETGLRQLIRKKPLETEVICYCNKKFLVPTESEILRTKAWMIVSRNATRDYMDFAVIVEKMGNDIATKELSDFDLYYQDIYKGDMVSPSLQLAKQCGNPLPHDLEDTDISLYKGVSKPYNQWQTYLSILQQFAKKYFQTICQLKDVDIEDSGPR